MSEGLGNIAYNTPAAATMPAPPFDPTSAYNGLSVDSTGKIVLGQDEIGDGPASLIDDRVIPMNGFRLELYGGKLFIISNLGDPATPGLIVENPTTDSVGVANFISDFDPVYIQSDSPGGFPDIWFNFGDVNAGGTLQGAIGANIAANFLFMDVRNGGDIVFACGPDENSTATRMVILQGGHVEIIDDLEVDANVVIGIVNLPANPSVFLGHDRTTGDVSQKGTSGSAQFSGNGVLTSFVVNHGMGAIPDQVLITAGNATTLLAFVSAKAINTFTVTFTVAPGVGTNNIVFDWIALSA